MCHVFFSFVLFGFRTDCVPGLEVGQNPACKGFLGMLFGFCLLHVDESLLFTGSLSFRCLQSLNGRRAVYSNCRVRPFSASLFDGASAFLNKVKWRPQDPPHLQGHGAFVKQVFYCRSWKRNSAGRFLVCPAEFCDVFWRRLLGSVLRLRSSLLLCTEREPELELPWSHQLSHIYINPFGTNWFWPLF